MIGQIVPGVGVIFDDYNGVIPDLLFVTEERRRKILAGGRLTAAPEIALEILSPGSSNERRDRHIKREGGLEFFAALRGADVLTSETLPGFSVAAEAFFAE
jgi:Uma2 family endonuclease